MGSCRSNRAPRRRPFGRRSVRRSVGRWTPGRRRRSKKLWGRNASTRLGQYVHVISCTYFFAKRYIKNWDVMGNHILYVKTENSRSSDLLQCDIAQYNVQFCLHHYAVQSSIHLHFKTVQQKSFILEKR